MLFLRLAQLCLLCLALTSTAQARGLKEQIGKDRVQLVDGKMKVEQFSLCKVTVPGTKKSSMQLRTYSEVATNAGVSRDFLVSFDATMRAAMVIGLGQTLAKGTAGDPLKALTCDPISAPIGKVDFEFSLYLTADGYQVAILDASSGKTTQESKMWDDAGR